MIYRKENISKVIYLLDKHIVDILSKKVVDDEKLSSLSDIRSMYIGELNNLIRNQNTSDMFDKKYYNSYRKSN